MMRASGAPNPRPTKPEKTIALAELLGWIVARPTSPLVKIRNPTINGARIDFNFVLAKPYTTVLNPPQIQAGWALATSRNGSVSKSDVVLFPVLMGKGKK